MKFSLRNHGAKAGSGRCLEQGIDDNNPSKADMAVSNSDSPLLKLPGDCLARQDPDEVNTARTGALPIATRTILNKFSADYDDLKMYMDTFVLQPKSEVSLAVGQVIVRKPWVRKIRLPYEDEIYSLDLLPYTEIEKSAKDFSIDIHWFDYRPNLCYKLLDPLMRSEIYPELSAFTTKAISRIQLLIHGDIMMDSLQLDIKRGFGKEWMYRITFARTSLNYQAPSEDWQALKE
ncbi:hypothetical protein NX059_012002 [Plenodomus lindquistii]|nr:hypothetical protein NX059_012002 [Plenodomus lindquistii]